MSRKYNKRCYGRQDLLLLPSGLQNPKKTLDNQDTHMITSVMLARQITLPNPPNRSNSFAPTFLQPLGFLFATSVVCFQQLAASFRKTPGVGVRARKSRHSHFQPFPRSGAATPFLPITSLQTQQFHAITHSFAQRQPNISIVSNALRTLSIATGVVPLRPSGGRRRRRVRGRCCRQKFFASPMTSATSVCAISVVVVYVPGGGVPVQTC